MPRGIKQRKSGLDTDFTITDAVKRAKTRREQLRKAAGYSDENEIDSVSDQLDRMGESESIRSIFED